MARGHGFTIQKDLVFYGYDGEMNPFENIGIVFRK
jgi:hypothetical protein